jgi:hypothetical protein
MPSSWFGCESGPSENRKVAPSAGGELGAEATSFRRRDGATTGWFGVCTKIIKIKIKNDWGGHATTSYEHPVATMPSGELDVGLMPAAAWA